MNSTATPSQQPTRATNLSEMSERLKHFSTPEGVRQGLAFPLNASDVVIATPSKCGTTWMQQIVHGLRTRGDMDFDEITRVVPWLEMAADMGIDLDYPQVRQPRVFKSHKTLAELPMGGRYIVVLRDPADALMSLYHFFSGWIFEKGSITLHDFAMEVFVKPGRWWKHAAALLENRKMQNVLPLFYEDMKADLPHTVERVARFITVALDDELKALVLAQSDIGFMQAHDRQFDDHLIRESRNPAMGLPVEGATSKVRTGQVGEARLGLPQAVKDAMEAVWQEEIGGRFGLESYAALRRELAG